MKVLCLFVLPFLLRFTSEQKPPDPGGMSEEEMQKRIKYLNDTVGDAVGKKLRESDFLTKFCIHHEFKRFNESYGISMNPNCTLSAKKEGKDVTYCIAHMSGVYGVNAICPKKTIGYKLISTGRTQCDVYRSWIQKDDQKDEEMYKVRDVDVGSCAESIEKQIKEETLKPIV